MGPFDDLMQNPDTMKAMENLRNSEMEALVILDWKLIESGSGIPHRLLLMAVPTDDLDEPVEAP